MKQMSGWREWVVAMANGPWGKGPNDGDKGEADGGKGEGGGEPRGPRNPWTPPPGGPRPRDRGPSAFEQLWERGRAGFGGGGLPRGPGGRQLWPIALAIVVLLWLALTVAHPIAPQERGIVTRLGKYSRTLTPGFNLTLPAPFESVEKVQVENIQTIDIGSTAADQENLMLTGDQNIIDLAYSVRWNVSNPEYFRFQLREPQETIREVAESAMRAEIASVKLDDAVGRGRAAIEGLVQQRMQDVLDSYKAGVRIQGVAIKQADPPAAVNDAFKDVTSAKQEAESYLNNARAYAQQVTNNAQGSAAAFDKVYAQYKLAPDVTRRRMYYETMEQVLAGIDKTIVESGNVTPYLPLPEIKRRAATATPTTEGEQR